MSIHPELQHLRDLEAPLRFPSRAAWNDFWADGATFEPVRDSSRLAAQMKSVFELMKDGRERTLKEIADGTGSPESSVSARLRDLRKERFGGYTVNRFYIARGLFSYQLLVTEAAC